MSEARMTSKGQITVPKDVRQKLKLQQGDRVRFLIEEDGRVRLMPVKRDISELIGVLPKPRRALSIDEMDDAIGRAVTEKLARHDRG